jgi:hypothetical protein
MAGYIGSKASVVSSGAEHKKVFDITTTTTSLTGLVYTPTLVHVFHNGVRLVDGTDYTATSGTTITLTVAAENGDQVVVISYATFQTSDTVSASAGGTFGNNVSVTGTLAATAVTGDGSGLTSLTSANLTGALPAISGAALTSLPAGSVLQVVNGTRPGASVSTTSLVDVSWGATASITPTSSSSKIYVIASGGWYLSAGTATEYAIAIQRNGVTIPTASNDGLTCVFGAGQLAAPYVITILDTPATTSSTTYLVVAHNINSGTSPLQNGVRATQLNQITLMEIAV